MNIRYDRIIAWGILLLMIIMLSTFAINAIIINTSNDSPTTSIEESNISIPETEFSEIKEESSIIEEESEELIEDSSIIVEEESSENVEESEEDLIRGPMGIESSEEETQYEPTPPVLKPAEGFVYYTHYYHPNKTKYPNPIKIDLSYEHQVLGYNLCQKYNVPFELMLGLWEKETTFRINIGRVWGGDSDPAWYCGIGMLSEEHCYYSLKSKYNVNIHTPVGGLEGSIIIMKEKLDAFDDNNLHLALMAYNGGNGYAQRLIDKQIYSTEYSEHIMFVANNLIAENNNG